MKISLANRCDTSTGLTTWAARKLTKTKRLNAVLFERTDRREEVLFGCPRVSQFSAFNRWLPQPLLE